MLLLFSFLSFSSTSSPSYLVWEKSTYVLHSLPVKATRRSSVLPTCAEHQVLLERDGLVQLHPGQLHLVEVVVKLRLCQLHLVEVEVELRLCHLHLVKVVVQCCRDPPFLHLAEVVVKLSLRQ